MSVSPDGLKESDRDLLLAGRAATVTMNRANATRWSALVAFFRRRLAGQRTREIENPYGALTARQETVVEVGELWGMATGALRSELNAAIFLFERLPSVWAMVQDGSLDRHRARLISDTVRREVGDEDALERLDARLSRYLLKQRRTVDGDEDALVCCTTKQLQNKLSYEIRRLRSTDAEERFARKYADRKATAQAGEDGVGWLTIEHSTDRVQLAHHRLTLAAKELRTGGDSRTIDQLRSDLALDLLIGANFDGEQANVPVPTFARPIINVTVPIQTLMGISDHPAELSGGTVIPAGLARVIAQRPGATWHRMLTDERGEMTKLSTKSYQPTAPIWRHVVAAQSSCFRPGCDRPATECELDHRVPWPEGDTSTDNLWPACKADHKAKHASGFQIQMTETGQFELRTPTGFSHPIATATHPTSTEWPDVLPVEGIQYSATELRDALLRIREERRVREIDYVGIWEDGDRALFMAADNDLIDAVYAA